MKKMLMTSKMLLLIGALTFGLTSCTKKSVTSDDTETAAAQNLNVAEIEDDNTQIMADEAEANGSVSLRTSSGVTSSSDLLTSCAVVTRDTVSIPRTITIDFGTGCTNAHGTTRKGKLLITYTGRYRDEGTVVHIVSQDYYVNDNKVDIDRTITNQGLNTDGNYVFGIHATRTVTFPGGETSSSTVDKTREWIEGASTPRVFEDDVYRVTGTGTHTSRRGILYDASTVTPLIRKVDCHEFVSGTVKIVRHGNNDRTAVIDFGDGTCDDEAVVTLDNGRTFTIDLRH
ncbi:MAG: hypothetical protein JWN78_147 [Bacteroidota bacterium]|nr:hypothetical protein [Bacteroidota bacterium]